MASSPKKTLGLDLDLTFISKKLLPNFLANTSVFVAAASGSGSVSAPTRPPSPAHDPRLQRRTNWQDGGSQSQ